MDENETNTDMERLMNKVGGDGKAQWYLMTLMMMTYIASGCPLLMHKFSSHLPSHRCRVDICESSPANTNWEEFVFPKTDSSSDLWLKSNYSSCKMYKMIDGTSSSCEANNFDKSETVSCNSWKYGIEENEPEVETLATEMNLVCGDRNKINLLDTLLILGILFGSLIGGKCGDYFGRKMTSYGAICTTIPALIIGGYPGYYIIYAGCRFITAGCMAVLWICMQSLTVEFISSKKRELFVAVKDMFFPVSQILTAFIAYLTYEHYSYLHLTLGLLCVFSLIAVFLIPESVRWGILHGMEDKSKETLVKIAKLNGKKLSDEDLDEISLIFAHIAKNSQEDDHGGKLEIWHLFDRSQLKKTIILSINWITVAIGFYTLNLNNTRLAGSIYANFALSNFVEIPFTIVIFSLLKYLPRRLNLFIYQFVVGTTAIALAFIPRDMNWLILIVYNLGKICAGSGFLMVWLLPAEMYPTNLRAQALGTFSTVARIFSVTAAYITNLAIYWRPLPMLVMGIPTICSGFLAYFLHETSGVEIPQTMKHSKILEANKKNNNANDATELK